MVMEKKTWSEKKVNLSSAIIIGFVLAVVGGVVGANWNNWFGGYGTYLGWSNNGATAVDWSPLNEVYNKLASTYNGEISTSEIIEGAKKGLTDSLGDKYTTYMTAEETSEFMTICTVMWGAG